MLTKLMRNLLVLTLLLAGTLSAQSGIIRVAVTDPLHRFVTGLEPANFEVLENGMPLAITSFSAGNTPVAMAVVTRSDIAAAEIPGRTGDEVSVSSSVTEALRRLADSKISRKVLVLDAPVNDDNVPADVQVVQAAPWGGISKELVAKIAVELRNQYILQYQPSTPGATVEVVLKQPQGMPVLKVSRSI